MSIAYYDSKHDMIFAEKQPGEDNYCSQLVQITSDGTQLAVVFDPATLNWTYEKNDKVQYSDLSSDGKQLRGNVQHIGYRKGISIGWRDVVLEEEQIKVELH